MSCLRKANLLPPISKKLSLRDGGADRPKIAFHIFVIVRIVEGDSSSEDSETDDSESDK